MHTTVHVQSPLAAAAWPALPSRKLYQAKHQRTLYIVYPNKILHEIYLISSVDKDEILLIFIQSSRQYCCSIRVATSKKSADKRSVVVSVLPAYDVTNNSQCHLAA